jgi:hypothetical protein
MGAEEVDEEELELLKKHRAKKQKDAESDREVWIRQGDNEAAVPYSKAKKWLQETFHIDLDEEPVQDQPDAQPGQQQQSGQGGDGVRRFAGRRVS